MGRDEGAAQNARNRGWTMEFGGEGPRGDLRCLCGWVCDAESVLHRGDVQLASWVWIEGSMPSLVVMKFHGIKD